MMYIILRILTLSGLLLYAQPTLSDEGRLNILVTTNKLEKLNERGHSKWQIEMSKNKISYDCISCEKETTATLEVLSADNFEDLNSLKNHYIAMRKKLCADAATSNTGRCLGTRPASLRIGMPGFRSEFITSTYREIELVSFYWRPAFFTDRTGGLELLKATLIVSANAPVPTDFANIIWWLHMGRLTHRF